MEKDQKLRLFTSDILSCSDNSVIVIKRKKLFELLKKYELDKKWK